MKKIFLLMAILVIAGLVAGAYNPRQTFAQQGTPCGPFTVGGASFTLPPGQSVILNGELIECPADNSAPSNGASSAGGGNTDPASFTITGDVPNTVVFTCDDIYVNTMGSGTECFVAEPGGLTGDQGDPQCEQNPACTPISPDSQHKLTDADEEIVDVSEGGLTIITFAGGCVNLIGVTICLEAKADNTWFLIVKGLTSGPGDRNLPMRVYNYNAAFTLETNIRNAALLSENYLKDNMATGHTKGNCGLSGCQSVSLFLYDANTGAWSASTQPYLDGPIIPLGGNFPY